MDVQHGIVLGCPRSGTSFLMRALNALPYAECVTGTILPVAVPHVVNRDDLPEDVYDALAVGFERALDAYLHSGRFNARAAALQKWTRAPSTGLSGLVQAVRGHRTVRRIIYKEPFLSLAPDFVWHALPEARIVHIYRDGRDCANSLVRTYDVLTDERLTHLLGSEMRLGRPYDHRYIPWWVEEGRDEAFIESTPYVRAIWMWKYMVRRCHDFFSRPEVKDTGRVLLLRYEDLMRDPLTSGRAVARHFGAASNSAFEKRLERAHTKSIGSYKRRPPAEIEAAEDLARAELELYSYALTPPAASAASVSSPQPHASPS